MKILKKGIVYRVNEGPFRYQAWPTVTQDENGVLYAAWSGHRHRHICPFGVDLLATSTDGGESWSAPIIANDSPLDDRDAGITYLGNGEMLLSYFKHPTDVYVKSYRPRIIKDADPLFRPVIEAFLKVYENYPPSEDIAGSFIRRSSDYGKSWSEPIRVPISAPHGAVKTQSGRLLYLGRECPGILARYYNGMEDPLDTVPHEDRERIFLYESFDGGESWEKLSKIPLDHIADKNKMCEPHIVELPSGELIAAIRAHTNPIYDDYTTYFSSSTDGGKSWSEAWSFKISGSPPHLLLRRDGSVLVSYGRRMAPFGIRAVVSYDGCRTFSEEYVLSEDYNGDLGYPSTVELDDGSLVTVYYGHYEDDTPTSILYTKWSID